MSKDIWKWEAGASEKGQIYWHRCNNVIKICVQTRCLREVREMRTILGKENSDTMGGGKET